MLVARENIVWRKKKGLLVVLDTDSGNYFTLNETAQDLWIAHIVEGVELDTVINQIAQSYGNNPPVEQIKSDCLTMIDGWKENNLIVTQED